MRLIPAPISSMIRAKVRSWHDGAIGWRRTPAGTIRPFIITGPPRSGTSLMNALLGRKGNVVVVNEPLELMPRVFLKGDSTRKLRGFLNRTARRAVEQGVVVNKVDPKQPDRPTSDTFNQGAQWRAIPIQIDRAQPVCVAAKATMPLLDCLETVCEQWPELQVLIMVREPGPTIRSWKQTFGWQPGLDRAGAGYQFRIYDKVDRQGDALVRRARLWRALVEEAMRLADQRSQQVRIVRYERLLERPADEMAAIFSHIGAANPQEPIDVSDVRPQQRPGYVGFSEEEADVIREACAATVQRLEAGY